MKNVLISLLLLVSLVVSGQTKISDGVLKATVSGAEKIPVSGTGHPVINSNRIYTYAKARFDSVYFNKAGLLTVPFGGTGKTSITAYAPLFGGTTSTGAFQSGAVGTLGQILTSNGAGALATFQNTNSVTPEMYGAVGDGTTNDAVALQAAFDTGRPVWIKNSYRTNTAISLTTQGQLVGGNGTINTASNISILSIQTKQVRIENINLLANNSGAAQYGISIIGNVGLTLDYTSNVISNVTFKGFGDSGSSAGIYIYRVVGTTSTKHQGAAYVANCFFDHCNVGVYLDDRAEYNNFVNCSIYDCTTGAYFKCGVQSWIGGHITDNAIGMEFAHGSNDAHGVVIGVVFGHNGNTALKATGITVWQTIMGCEFSTVGNIDLSSSTGFKFAECEFFAAAITLANSPYTEFINNRFGDVPTLTPSGTTTVFSLNNRITGAGSLPAELQNTDFALASGQKLYVNSIDVTPGVGTYTPTLTNTTNVAASTAYVTGYYRIGASVTVYGKVDIDATLAANTATELQITLPIASDLAAEQDLGGTAVSDAVASLTARIKGDATSNKASVVFKALSLNNDSYSFEFSYQVK